MIVKTGAVMIMGCKSRQAQNGNTYYNVDVYDCESGNLYRCSAIPEVFNQIANMETPAQVKFAEIDVSTQYKGQSRLELVNWS